MSALEGYTDLAKGSVHRRARTRSLTRGPQLRLERRVVVALLLLALALALGSYEELGRTGSGRSTAARAHHLLLPDGLLSLPAAAQAPTSAALGADSPAYAAYASAGGLRAGNPAQRLLSRFGASGVEVSAGAATVHMRLSALGYGSQLAPVGPAEPRVQANRVRYAHPGIEESYANGPLGLEQGFTVTRRPRSRGPGSLALAIAISGSEASMSRDGGSIIFGRPGEHALRYSGLRASDATGRPLTSWLSLGDNVMVLHVQARGARYPLRIDPSVARLEPESGEQGAARFGYRVAMSANGGTILIGGPENNTGAGAAWVFIHTGHSGWKQQGGVLTPTDETGDGNFGAGVALSADGNTALIGGPSDSEGTGAAWVFTRSGEVWKQQGTKITGLKESGAGEFGASVALSADGNTALIGGPIDDTAKFGLGAAWVFTRGGETWTQQGKKLTGGKEEVGAGVFGASVALSSDGNTALIGAPNDSPGEVFREGAAWVFRREGSTWSQQGPPLTGGEGEAGYFGASVALSSDGNTALIGAPGGGFQAEPAFVFTRFRSAWSKHAQILGEGEASGSSFGGSVAISADGETALIGGPGDGGSAGATWGSAAVLTGPFNQSADKQTFNEATGETGEGDFGESVALVGKLSLIGAPARGGNLGGAWVFEGANEETKEGTRFGVSGLGPEQFGKCEPKKHGEYSGNTCEFPDEKKGKPKGSFEWYPAPQTCFEKKHGNFADKACTEVHTAKGKYEKGSERFTGSGGSASFEISGSPSINCTSSSAEGTMLEPRKGTITITFSGCKREGISCQSAGPAPETISTNALEVTIYEGEQKGHYFTGLSNEEGLVTFECAKLEFTLIGEVGGERTGDINAMSTESKSAFKSGSGFQGLVSEGSIGTHGVTLTTSLTLTGAGGAEADEVNAPS